MVGTYSPWLTSMPARILLACISADVFLQVAFIESWCLRLTIAHEQPEGRKGSSGQPTVRTCSRNYNINRPGP